MIERPHENCYWVEPGQLLAGEYPGALTQPAAVMRLTRFLDCGVTYFVDLTQENELEPYASLLAELANGRAIAVTHRRFAIPDKGVPDSTSLMQDILTCIQVAIAEGETVYVHCWGGIGRTGTVIGCYLAEKEGSADNALQTLSMLWTNMEKRTRSPRTPETTEQTIWVKNWLPHASG